MSSRKRVAIGQISSESNHFVSASCDLEFFNHTGYVLPHRNLFQLREMDNEVAGMLSVLESENIDIVPLLAARANSAGPLSASCYDYLKSGLLDVLKETGKVDGVLLSHHGSMTSVDEDDTEGDISSSIREIVGPDVPIVMTLDLHANVTGRMVRATNAILGYEKYPHEDVYNTGSRAARLLLSTLRGKIRPVMAHAKIPMLLTAFHGSTEENAPFGKLMREAKSLEREAGLVSASLFFVGSYIDVPEIGSSVLVVSDNELERSISAVLTMAEKFWRIRREFDVLIFNVADAIARGRMIEGGPILLLDTSDTTGGGAAGDGIGVLKGLLNAGVTESSLLTIVDPDAVQQCLRTGRDKQVTISLGHKVDPRWGNPIEVTGKVIDVSDGRFRYAGGLMGGLWSSMGPSVVFSIGHIKVLITSYATYEWANEQYASVNLDPTKAKFVGVKNMMNFRNSYGETMKAYFVLDLPGPTPPDMRMLSFQRVQRPIYPLDQELSEPTFQLSTSGSHKC